jgi:hypothetical protein
MRRYLMIRTIELEDHGQDFLEWDIDETGKVVDCRPFQAWVWNGTIVHNKDIRVGDILLITTTHFPDESTTLNYPVKSVREGVAA